jgi:glycosyltransferase involved in cell wall biosynthesis
VSAVTIRHRRSGTRPSKSAAWAERLELLARTLRRPTGRAPGAGLPERELAAAVARIIDAKDLSETWLALAVMSAQIPLDDVVSQVARDAEFTQGEALGTAIVEATTATTVHRRVEVLPPKSVVVDVSATLEAPFTTGIQRVVLETVSRWERDHGAIPVAWSRDFRAMRRLTEDEAGRVQKRRARRERAAPAPDCDVVVPWRCTFLEPEVLAEVARSASVRSLAQYAHCRTGAISHDCIPITFSETLIEWFGDTFAHHLSAMREFDRLAPVSEASATEHRGWRRALSATGRTGPEIDAVPLPSEVRSSSEGELAAARERFVVEGLPTVLVVGSSEPRKNHLAVLYAAEVLWRRRHRFCLTFIGGRAWGSDLFARKAEALADAGRPLDIATGVGDAELWAAYRVSRFTVFPSLAEGFGLPAAESLACGTPTITSDFGSMKEIAAAGGALLVDPRDDAQIVDAMERLLVDDALLGRLRCEARARPARTWDTYASETWDLLVTSGR